MWPLAEVGTTKLHKFPNDPSIRLKGSLTRDFRLRVFSLISVITNISANFRKNSKRPQWNTWGAWGTLIHDKNLKSKISCQTPFKWIGFCGRPRPSTKICTAHFLASDLTRGDVSRRRHFRKLGSCEVIFRKQWICQIRYECMLLIFKGKFFFQH